MIDVTRTARAAAWLSCLGDALATSDIGTAVALSGSECYWRDLLTFTWNIKTMEVLDHVAEMDADPKFDALVRRDLSVALDHRPLDFNGAVHCVDDTPELDNAPSPVRLTTRPWCTAMVGSIRSLRSARSRARIRSSSAPVSRE